jgi:hypothetical protein
VRQYEQGGASERCKVCGHPKNMRGGRMPRQRSSDENVDSVITHRFFPKERRLHPARAAKNGKVVKAISPGTEAGPGRGHLVGGRSVFGEKWIAIDRAKDSSAHLVVRDTVRRHFDPLSTFVTPLMPATAFSASVFNDELTT